MNRKRIVGQDQDKEKCSAGGNIDKENDFPLWRFEQEIGSFPQINKNDENKNIIKFQKTGDESILEKLYHDRVPTIRCWAKNYHYLYDGVEDMFQELTQVFIRAVHKYKSKYKAKGKKNLWKSTPFNTYLYYSFKNFLKNIRTGKRAKKRTPWEEKFRHGENFMLSLDYDYVNKKDGDEITLKDMIPDDSMDESQNKLYLEETLDVIANEHPHVKKFLRKLSDGTTLSALLKEYMITEGFLKISDIQSRKLGSGQKFKNTVKELIRKKINVDNFKLLHYHIQNKNQICYTIERKKSDEMNSIIKSIRKIRKDKAYFINKIKGENCQEEMV